METSAPAELSQSRDVREAGREWGGGIPRLGKEGIEQEVGMGPVNMPDPNPIPQAVL